MTRHGLWLVVVLTIGAAGVGQGVGKPPDAGPVASARDSGAPEAGVMHHHSEEGTPPGAQVQPETAVNPAHAHSDAEEHGHGCCGGEPKGFFADLVPMLSKFHPPAVNFPIAMLIGAAVAELLLMATGRPIYAVAGRFCIWFGVIGAVVAALLGWFLGGFSLEDSFWPATIHRWLGTSTVVWSAIVLFLGERAARQEQASRTPYRVALLLAALLVATTGFFGGSVRYGLHYYLT